MDRKQQLVDMLSKEYQEFVYKRLFEILDAENYTTNSNGIFIRLNDIDEKKIEESIEFIDSINLSYSIYKKSECNREDNLKLIKNSIKNTKPKSKSRKKTITKAPAAQTKKKDIPLKGVFKRIEECMGRRVCRKNLELSDDSDQESNNSDRVSKQKDSDGDDSDQESKAKDSDGDLSDQDSNDNEKEDEKDDDVLLFGEEDEDDEDDEVVLKELDD